MRITIFLGLVLLGAGCQNPAPSSSAAAAPSSELLTYFEDLGPGDTLFVGYDEEGAAGDSIPVRLFWAELDSTLLEQIGYGPDSTSMVARARGQWAQDSLRTACLMKVELYWWKFQYLLIYDRQTGAFTGIRPLAEFYGGEGGQIATVSWLFDQDGDGDRDIVTRSSEHMMEMLSEDSEPVERHTDEVYVWRWEDAGYKAIPAVDSAALVKAWRVEWGW